MHVAPDKERAFEEFVLERDILYFRVGDHGLVSFHGRNFNWRKRFSTEELRKVTSQQAFFQVNTDCYVNTARVSVIRDGCVYFDTGELDGKSVMITKLRQSRLKDMLSRRLAKEA
ncbi:hypothetical protein ACFFK0_02645 [Paenibacillus chartarius]|uniref:HTH LytTR-type domain-containing protein n=1 Tax=Paenibacillus chartarius TaxID=747481 RepID=A0ABV6DFE7_9BACL